MNKKIVIWNSNVRNLIDGEPIGGIAVQMYFWAQVFVKHGWNVVSFVENGKKTTVKENIKFKTKRNIARINLLLEWWNAFKTILIERPDYIIYRGANRELLPLAIVSKWFGVKLLFFSASDVNFEPGNELVGSERNRKLYQRSIKYIKFFIVQNNHQHDTLLSNYHKDSFILPNIWGTTHWDKQNAPSETDVVWIANFRRLKRAEWVLSAAERMPAYKYVMAGAAVNDCDYYENMKNRAAVLDNVSFLGGQSFFYTNALVANSKVLLCTSTFEGFPNTFLQAWSNALPVISTVDPSGIIRSNNLGIVVETEEELYCAIQKVLGNNETYEELQQSVKKFFENNHSSESGYNKLLKYIK